MKIPLYLLGLLQRHGPQHGYGLKQIVSREVADFTHIKLPTIYYHLEKMEKRGLISSRIIKDSNRPDRMEYSITDAGRTEFRDLLHSVLHEDEYETEFLQDALMYFGEFVQKKDLLAVFERKRSVLDDRLKNLVKHRNAVVTRLPEGQKESAAAIFRHHQLHLEAERLWLEEILKE